MTDSLVAEIRQLLQDIVAPDLKALAIKVSRKTKSSAKHLPSANA